MKKIVGFIILAILILFLGFKLVFINRIYPMVRVVGVDLSGYTSQEALVTIGKKNTL